MYGKTLSLAVAVVLLFSAVSASAAVITSNGTGGGNWGSTSTWNGGSIPLAGDSVIITASDTVAVTDLRNVGSVQLDTTSGTKVLDVQSGGNLTLTATGNALLINAPTIGNHLVQLTGGSINITSGDLFISGGTSTVARVDFNAGGTLTTNQILFSGNATNARLTFSGGSGNVNLAGNLGSGGTITPGSSTFTFNGSGSQTINGYTLYNLTINKTGTATLNGAVTVNGNLAVTSGVLDDGGFQISLNAGSTSLVTIGTNGVLKLGSATSATSFPNPVSGANVSMSPNAAVVYQAGVSGQSIDKDVTYRRLFMQTLAGSVSKVMASGTISVLEDLDVDSNGVNTVTFQLGPETLDVDGNINSDGTINVTSGAIHVGGNVASTMNLVLGASSTVFYDGSSNQNVLGTTYHHLTINKSGGTALLNGTTGVNGDLTVLGAASQMNMQTNPMSVLGTFTNDGIFTIGSNTLQLRGDIVNDGTIATGASSTLRLNGTAPQSWSGVGNNSLNLVQVQNANNLTFSQDMFIKDLDLQANSGKLIVGSPKKISITSGGSITRAVTANWIVGALEMSLVGGIARTYTVGTMAGYAPVDVTPAANGNLTIEPGAGIHPFASGNALSRYWTLSNLSGFATADLTFNYNVADISGTEASYVGARYNGGWTTLSAVDNINHKIVATGETNITGDWTAGEPAAFAAPSTLTVTTINDSGAGSLRDAITTVNAGGCTSPCTIEFGSTGTGNIVLSSPLPALGANAMGLTIDGFTGLGATANTNVFGSASNANITVTLDGNNFVPIGLEIQTSNVTIKGLGFHHFNTGGAGEAIKINGGANNVVRGCYIGVDSDGITAHANYYGIVLYGAGAMNNLIGGASDDTLNVISGNTTWGILITNGANNNEIKTNYIGTSANVNAALGNGSGGISIDAGCDFNKVGTFLRSNVISGHASGTGIRILGSDNEVKHNFIGLDGVGSGAIPNNVGVALDGNDNYVGGIGTDRNFISGNTTDGITISTDDNAVSNNYIGTDSAGTSAIPNGGHGINLTGTAANNEIGLPNGNLIASNGGRGIQLTTTGIGNVMRQNVIRNNTSIAIDLAGDGATANDLTDADAGAANNKQNFPDISSAVINGSDIDVTLSINSSAGVNVGGFQIDIYGADTSSPSQAAVYLGASGCIAGSVLSSLVISVTNAGLVSGDKVVATATAYTTGTCTTASEGTSELSPPATISGDIHWINAAGGSFETASNWSPAVVPSSGDNVFIDAVGTYTVTMSASHTVNNISIGIAGGTQTLDVAGSTFLTINNPSTLNTNGILALANASGVGGNGTLDVNGILNWNGGTIAGVAALNVNSGGVINIGSASAKTLSQRLLTVNSGANVFWTGGNLALATGGAISNIGQFQIQSDAVLSNAGGGGAFTNTGNLSKSVTTGTTQFTNVNLNHNGGTLDLQTGTLDLAGATMASVISMSATAELLINDNNVTFATGTSFAGTGNLHVNGGTLTVNANVTIPKTTLDTGVIDGTGTLSSNSAFNWNGGAMQGSGITEIGGGTLTMATAAAKTLSQRTLRLLSTSTATWSGAGQLQLQSGGNVDNQTLLDVTTDSGITNLGGAGAFLNNTTGTFRKSAGAGSFTIANTTFTNNGTLQIQSGTFDPATFGSTGPIQLSGSTIFLVNSDVASLFAGTAITGFGLLQQTAGTLTVDANVTPNNLQLDGGTLNGSGTLSPGVMTWNGGLMSGTGTTQMSGTSTLSIATAAAKTLSRPLNITSASAIVTVSGTGTLSLGTGGSITNTGLINVTADMSISGGGSNTITNNGTFRKSTGPGTLVMSNLAFDNNATLDVQSGIVDLPNGTNTSVFQIASTCEVLVNSDTYNLNSGSSVTGAGKLKQSAGNIVVSGVPVPVSNFQMIGGVLTGTGTLNVQTNGDWSGGSMQQSLGTTLVSGAFSISGAGGKNLDGRAFSVGATGAVNLNGTGSVTLTSGGNFTNNGAFVLNADNSFFNGGGAGGFTNNGTFTKQSTTGTTTFSNMAFTNTGTVDLQTGILAVTGAFSQTSGLFKLHFGGTTPGTQFSQLQTASNPTLGGTLQVLLVGLYQPNPGDTFRAVSIPGGAHTGTFTPNYPALTGGRTWSEAYDGSGLLLSVNGSADLTIGKSAPANVQPGAAISYTLSVTNNGPDPASGVSVTDVLQTGHTSISANGSGWTCNVVTLTVTCTAASLPTGAAPNITINANAPTTPQTFTNVANVNSSNDPTPGNNSGSAIVTVNPAQADLAVTGFATPAGPVATGTPVTFNFTITNNGPSTATGIVFTASIPAGLTFNSSAPSSPACNFSAGTLTCNFASIPSGNNLALAINTTTSTGGTQTVVASVSRVETDPTPANDSTSVSVAVSAGATLTVVNTNDSGTGSLRQAILDANANICTSPCTINFAIPGGPPYIISPLTDLPALTASAATIAGDSQTGYVASPLIRIDGNNARNVGLTINASNAVVRALSITRNTLAGIAITGNNDAVQGSWIGLDTAGLAAGNQYGIKIDGSSLNLIGGTTAAARNVISGNTADGIRLMNNANNNNVRGNYIGTNIAGNAAIGNGNGVTLADNADANIIGGFSPAEGNVISGNAKGIVILGTGGGTRCDGNAIRHNRIGVDAGAGTSAIANTTAGIELTAEASGTFIADNVVSGNALGIKLAGANTTGTFVQGNLVGLGADGTTALGNTTLGVDVDTLTTNTLVGGTFAGQGNTIANNTIGVAIFGNSAEVLGNSLFNNSGLGIDIDNDGPTANDATDSDTGANNKQNFPTITSAQIAGANVVIDYNINSSATAAGSILFEFYETDGVNEGKTFIGRVCRPGNNITFSSSFPAGSVIVGDAIVGTATSYSDGACATVLDGTSEFPSTPTVVTNCTPPSAGIASPISVCSGSTGNSASTTVVAGATYAWSIINGTITSATNGPSITFTAGASGTVDLQVIKTSSIGCSNTGNASVPITAPPAVTITGPTSDCPGAPITLDAGAGFASYLWNTGATSQQITVSPTVATTYSVTVTDSNGCSGTDSHNVTMNPVPTPTITGPTSTCASTPVTLDAGAGFASYLWNTGATSQQITVSPASTTTYSVTVTNGSGCSGSDSHTVTVTSNPTATISAPSSICANGSANASVVPQGGATYAWTVTNGTLNSGQGTTSINFTAAASGSVNISVLVTVGSCTSNGSASVPITAPPAPVITGPTAVCPNTTFILDAGPGFVGYAWNTGATTQQIAVSQSVPTGTYSVIVTAAGGCTGSDSHVVTLLANPDSTIAAPGNVDPGSTGNSASVPLQGGATYAWTATNATITSGAGTNAITFTAGTSGNVILGVTVTLGSCASSSSVAIPIGSTLADLAITKSATPTINAGGAITYTLSVTNNGPDAATNVIVTDNFPSGVTPKTASGGDWSCTVGATAIVCQTAVLGVGNAAPIIVSATGPSVGGSITNTASVSSSIGDPDGANNSGSATTVVNAPQTPQCAQRLGPVLLSPAQLASVSSPVTFTWTSISDALDYDVFYIAGNAPPALAGTTASTSLTTSIPSGPITWWVVARPAICGPLISNQGQFTVITATNCAHGSPQPVAPSLDATVGSPVQFSWTPVPGAIGYRLFIAIGNEAPQDVATTGGATFFTANVQPGRITWFVDALFGGCPSTRSSSSAFNVVAPDPCANRGTATLVAPANNSTQPSASIDFAWNAVTNASEYRVWAQIDSGTPAVLGTTNDTTLHAAIARGVVHWWIDAIFPGCAATESQHFVFTVPEASRCDNTRPTILSPQNNATTTNANVTFAWTSVPGAVAYEVWLALNGGSPALLDTTSATALTAEVPAGVLDVFVRAIVSGCPARDSNVTRFRYEPPTPCATNSRPLLYSPLENNEVISPAAFVFTPGFGAIKHELYVAHGGGAFSLAGTTIGNGTIINNVTLQNGAGRWFVRAYFGSNCPPLDSTESSFVVKPQPAACSPLEAPVLSAPGQISTGASGIAVWNDVGASEYHLQIATKPDFSDATITPVAGHTYNFTFTNNGSEPLAMYLRVRGVDGRCNPSQLGPYSDAIVIFTLPTSVNDAATPAGTAQSAHYTIVLGPELAGQSFTATPNQPWLSVAPSNGVVPAGGLTLNVTANTIGLPVGTSTAGVVVTLNSSSARGQNTNASSSKTSTISVSLVTPVTPAAASTPPPDALIIPAVAHADGINSHFQSDVRLANTSSEVIKYEITFTPSGAEQFDNAQVTTLDVEPGRTIALDDVLRSWYGERAATGTLKIVPLTQSVASTPAAAVTGIANLLTFASSRTFNATTNGTFGQYIPAIPFANFIGSNETLTLQQIAQSPLYRTNLGFVEGSGQAASLRVTVFGSDGQRITDFPVDLTAGQHLQMGSFLAQRGIQLTDGRVEVQVTSPGGKVTAYASVLDATTSDPLLVTPVTLSQTGAQKWVVAGVADLSNGNANWRTDTRIFNAEELPVAATLSFYSQNGGAPKVQQVVIPAGQVLQLDSTLSSLFGISNDGGALHVSTSTPAKLVTTARTYNQTTTGTFGQFISGVTPNEAIGLGSRPLQILQVEESDRYRSNIGLAEVTGKPVRLEITAVPPDAKFSAVIEVDLGANEFRQFGSLLKQMGLASTYNGRVTVRVIEGEGRVTAYGSVIDFVTNDPTFMPAL